MAPAPSFPVPPPEPGEWDLGDNGAGLWQATILSAPGGVTFFAAQDNVNGAGFAFQGSTTIVAPIIGADAGPGDTVEVQIQWWNDATSEPLSDWSASKTVIL